jgi:hypothetical protein
MDKYELKPRLKSVAILYVKGFKAVPNDWEGNMLYLQLQAFLSLDFSLLLSKSEIIYSKRRLKKNVTI